MARLYDCFVFSTELDLLEIRLHELAHVVDFFVLAEAEVTFKGKPKPLVFQNNRDRFARFAERIRHVVVKDMPRGTTKADNWRRQRYQRNALIAGIDDARPEDVVVLSDVDEIPRAESVRALAATPDSFATVHCLEQRMYRYFLTYQCRELWSRSGPRAVRRRYLHTMQGLRYVRPPTSGPMRSALRWLYASAYMRRAVRRTVHEDAGWHFSSMGGVNAVAAKFRSNCAALPEHERDPGRDFADIAAARIAWAKADERLRKVPFDDSFPAFLLENRRATAIYSPTTPTPRSSDQTTLSVEPSQSAELRGRIPPHGTSDWMYAWTPGRRINMGNPVHVAWIFDDAVSLEASVAITSVVAKADPDRLYVLHLLVLHVSPARLTEILKLRRRNIRIDVHALNATSFDDQRFEYAKQVQFERIALARHLPDIGKIVYLDTDLVTHRDIAELYDTDLGGCPIGAVPDLHVGRQLALGRRSGGNLTLKAYFENTLSISGDLQKSYFNTGVLVLDLDLMCKQKIEERVREILDSGAKFVIPDQCVLNMLLLPKARIIDSRWKVLVPSTRLSLLIKRTPPDKKRRQDFADPFILHFAGGKPWHHRSRPKASEWWACASASPLKEEIISNFWNSRGRDTFSTIRSKALAPMQMALALGRLRNRTG